MDGTTVDCPAVDPQAGVDAEPRARDADRMQAAFDRCARSLYRFVLVRVGGDSHLADDILQQTWCQACQHSGGVPPNEVEFWLRAVARNLIRTHWRRLGRRPRHAPLPDAELAAEIATQLTTRPLALDYLSRREVEQQLLLAITELDADEQELIVEHYFHGCSHDELARRRNLSTRAVEGRLYRARQALRSRLNHLAAED
ncbi:MAG: sigma-70 family RNA polymerase sigma factor [Phycisphaerae bacterium]|jgi:RNA polymerase sigma-70 factor (ECF subfamily)